MNILWNSYFEKLHSLKGFKRILFGFFSLGMLPLVIYILHPIGIDFLIDGEVGKSIGILLINTSLIIFMAATVFKCNKFRERKIQ